jgi:hypothetical protein
MGRGGFDITKGTILDWELHPEHFDQVTRAIFNNFSLGKLYKTCKNADLVLTWKPESSPINHQSSFRMDMAMLNAESK